MVLTLKEKEKLVEKATSLYNEIKEINIRQQIKVHIAPKYYPSNCKYSDSGLTYYYKGGIGIFGEDVENSLKDLKEYIKYQKGEIDYHFVSDYQINALLDFIYYKDTILDTIKRTNERERNELNSLLD